jgi:hypothetical protein
VTNDRRSVPLDHKCPYTCCCCLSTTQSSTFSNTQKSCLANGLIKRRRKRSIFRLNASKLAYQIFSLTSCAINECLCLSQYRSLSGSSSSVHPLPKSHFLVCEYESIPSPLTSLSPEDVREKSLLRSLQPTVSVFYLLRIFFYPFSPIHKSSLTPLAEKSQKPMAILPTIPPATGIANFEEYDILVLQALRAASSSDPGCTSSMSCHSDPADDNSWHQSLSAPAGCRLVASPYTRRCAPRGLSVFRSRLPSCGDQGLGWRVIEPLSRGQSGLGGTRTLREVLRRRSQE